MITGPDALRSIEEALRDIRREEDEILRRLGRTGELVVRLRTQEGELCRQLISIRLDAAGREALSAEISAAEAAAFTMLREHDGALSEAAADLVGLDASIAAESAARAALQKEAAVRDTELRALAAKARPALGSDPGYGRLAANARRLAETAELALAKAAAAERAGVANAHPFGDDPLFMYLWRRQYAQPAYQAGPVAKALDGWVARLIDYPTARARFEAIAALPARLAEHAERLAEKARSAAREIAAIESRAVDSAGGAEARRALSAIVTRIEASDESARALADRRDEAMRADRGLAEGRDPAFSGTLEALTGLLSRRDLMRLVDEARTTPRGQDPTITAQLDDLRRRALEADDDLREQRGRLGTLEARRRDLEALVDALKANGFDNPHSSFADEDLIGDALDVFLHGEISLSGYWERWRLSHHWDAPGYGGPGGGWGLRVPPATDARLGEPGPVLRSAVGAA